MTRAGLLLPRPRPRLPRTCATRPPMTDAIRRRILLARRPQGEVTPDDFRLEQGPVPEPGPGEVLVRTIWLSLDPYMRGQARAPTSSPATSCAAMAAGRATSCCLRASSPGSTRPKLLEHGSGCARHAWAHGLRRHGDGRGERGRARLPGDRLGDRPARAQAPPEPGPAAAGMARALPGPARHPPGPALRDGGAAILLPAGAVPRRSGRPDAGRDRARAGGAARVTRDREILAYAATGEVQALAC